MNLDIYRHNEDIIFRQEEDEAILFNPDNSDVLTINSTGCLIWSLCDGENAKEEILKRILEEFDVAAEDAGKDLDGFLLDLEKRNFIQKIK